MTKEETEIFLQNFDNFVEETRRNFGQLFQDRQSDRELLEKVYGQEGVGGLKNEFHILSDNVKNQTKTVKKKSEELVEHIEGNTKVIIKETDKPKKRWYQVWRKGTNG